MADKRKGESWFRGILGISPVTTKKKEKTTAPGTMLGAMDKFMEGWRKKKRLPQDRAELYRLYDEIEDMVEEIGAFLDAIASEATQLNTERGHVVWATSKKPKVQARLDKLLHRKLKVDDWAYATVRAMAKYGDDPGELLYDKNGVQGIFWGIALTDFMRFETADGNLLGYALLSELSEKKLNAGGLTVENIKPHLSKPWDYVHFRILGDKKDSASDPNPVLYGTSLIRRAIRPARRLDLLNDLLLMYRASRSMDRFLLKIDVTGLTPEEQMEAMELWRTHLYELAHNNPDAGEFEGMGNPLAVGEDIIFPVTRDSASDIDTLQGNPNLYEAFDVDLAVNRLFGALNAPKALFGYEGGRSESDKPFASQDIRFAKRTFRAQTAFIEGVRFTCLVDLAIAQNAEADKLALTDDELMDPNLFQIHMIPPSAILHLHRLEAFREALDAARDMMDLGDEMELPKDEWNAHILRTVISAGDYDIDAFAKVLEKRAKEVPKGDEEEPEETPDKKGKRFGETDSLTEEQNELLEELKTRRAFQNSHRVTREQLPRKDIKENDGSNRLVCDKSKFVTDEAVDSDKDEKEG